MHFTCNKIYITLVIPLSSKTSWSCSEIGLHHILHWTITIAGRIYMQKSKIENFLFFGISIVLFLLPLSFMEFYFTCSCKMICIELIVDYTIEQFGPKKNPICWEFTSAIAYIYVFVYLFKLWPLLDVFKHYFHLFFDKTEIFPSEFILLQLSLFVHVINSRIIKFDFFH